MCKNYADVRGILSQAIIIQDLDLFLAPDKVTYVGGVKNRFLEPPKHLI